MGLTTDRAPSAPEGPPAGGGHRELIEESREHKQGRMGNNWPWCWACNAKWPCLPVRLADALEQQEADSIATLLDMKDQRDIVVLDLAAAERRVAELSVCGSWHCSGHRRCELERGHDGRHFTTSLGASYPGWDDSASVDVPQLLEALNDARHRAAELEQERNEARDALHEEHQALLRNIDRTAREKATLARSQAAAREALAHYASRETWEQVDESSVAGWIYTPDDEPWARATAIVTPADAPRTRTAGAQAVLEAEDERSGMEGTQ